MTHDYILLTNESQTIQKNSDSLSSFLLPSSPTIFLPLNSMAKVAHILTHGNFVDSRRWWGFAWWHDFGVEEGQPVVKGGFRANRWRHRQQSTIQLWNWRKRRNFWWWVRLNPLQMHELDLLKVSKLDYETEGNGDVTHIVEEDEGNHGSNDGLIKAFGEPCREIEALSHVRTNLVKYFWAWVSDLLDILGYSWTWTVLDQHWTHSLSLESLTYAPFVLT